MTDFRAFLLGDDEQVKNMKSLEESSSNKESSSIELPKLIFKNLQQPQEKSTNSIKIAKSQVNKSSLSEIQLLDSSTITPPRKERKRKRTDSLESKGIFYLFAYLN